MRAVAVTTTASFVPAVTGTVVVNRGEHAHLRGRDEYDRLTVCSEAGRPKRQFRQQHQREQPPHAQEAATE